METGWIAFYHARSQRCHLRVRDTADQTTNAYSNSALVSYCPQQGRGGTTYVDAKRLSIASSYPPPRTTLVFCRRRRCRHIWHSSFCLMLQLQMCLGSERKKEAAPHPCTSSGILAIVARRFSPRQRQQKRGNDGREQIVATTTIISPGRNRPARLKRTPAARFRSVISVLGGQTTSRLPTHQANTTQPPRLPPSSRLISSNGSKGHPTNRIPNSPGNLRPEKRQAHHARDSHLAYRIITTRPFRTFSSLTDSMTLSSSKQTHLSSEDLRNDL